MQIDSTVVALATATAGSAARRIAVWIAGLAILMAIAIPMLLAAVVAAPAILIALPILVIATIIGGDPRDPIAPEPPRIAEVLPHPASSRVGETWRPRAAA